MTTAPEKIQVEPREILVERLEDDLLGPVETDEVLNEYPSARYLTGILFPPRTEVGPEEDDDSGDDNVGNDYGTDDSGVALGTMLRPSSAGISFAAESEQGRPSLDLRIQCGTYRPEEIEPEEDGSDSSGAGAGGAARKVWRRTNHNVVLQSLEVPDSDREIDLAEEGLEGLHLYLRAQRLRDGWAVTAALVNRWDEGEDRDDGEIRSFFQVAISAEPSPGTRFRGLPTPSSSGDEDDRVSELIYRDAVEFAAGHTCSAEWDSDGEDTVRVRSSWLPRFVVPSVSPDGDEIFAPLRADANLKPLSAEWLAVASAGDLVSGLRMLPDAYRDWIEGEEKRLETLPPHLRLQGRVNLDRCRLGADRMDGGIGLLENNAAAREAFQAANQAMRIQRGWGGGGSEQDLVWRPFQLAFQLLTLESLADRAQEDRSIADLLWFPTGGGKTEAYLALTAFLLFYRRLVDGPVEGAGVAVLMRYTLRVLTIQQFQRAAALVLACELIRRRRVRDGDDALGQIAFSLGLWVGGDATPNSLKDAGDVGEGEGRDYRQVRYCPCCGERLVWKRTAADVVSRCETKGCELAATGKELPIWTIDELVYRERPSLVIGTVDKFAQITRNVATGSLFSIDGTHAAPDLIIQDELHLISGPLGTLTALYEIAIDELCTRDGNRPKVIGSTATIRRASEHIDALFDREAFQFPPPALDAGNSCFAVEDRDAPGRLYVGLSTVGRSPKFTLQAASASLLQGATDNRMDDEARDPYWTLVEYFNALRELGGALVLMQDDVTYSIAAYASRRGEKPRELTPPEELTSRKSSSEIPEMLKALARTYGEEGVYDILLASNMISVGVDIPRLGLMLMNGQPKGIAEYIQATSRVGRGGVRGLILTVFNNGRARDRSHFETFPSWHRTLYRDVEATSVTPFASRAQDRGLHGVLVALVRHLVPGMAKRPTLSSDVAQEIRPIIERMVMRATSVDEGEAAAVAKRLEELVKYWEGREDLQEYWDDFGGKETLLMSAEQHAAKVSGGEGDGPEWPTPNSMREVEPSTSFVLKKGLSEGGPTSGRTPQQSR